MRCVSYTRVKSCREDLDKAFDSIECQNTEIKKFLDSNKWKLIRKYSDRKDSIAADKAFQEMLNDGMQRKFDCVLVYSVFRCGKNLWSAEEILLDTFYFAGIHFVVVEDGFNSVNASREEVIGYFYKKRNEYNGYRTKKAVAKRRSRGVLTLRDVKFGYSLSEDKTKLIVNEKEATIVRRIFQMCSEGISMRSIAKILTSEGVPTIRTQYAEKKGEVNRTGEQRKWSSTTIKTILEITPYKGNWVKIVDGEELICESEQIIPEDLYLSAIQKIKRPNRKHSGFISPNIFARKVFLSETDQSMFCRTNKVTGEKCFIKSQNKISSSVNGRAASIRFNIVYESVMKALYEEQQKAKHVKMQLESSEMKKMVDVELKVLEIEVNLLFEKCILIEKNRIPLLVSYENGSIDQEEYEEKTMLIKTRLTECEQQFKAILSREDELGVLYGRTNPWLLLFSESELPAELKRADVLKWVDKICVSNDETVSVKFQKSEWRERLPEKWLTASEDK